MRNHNWLIRYRALIQTKAFFRVEVWLPVCAAMVIGVIASSGGFVHYDESHVTLNTLKLLQHWTHPLKDPIVLIWPEQGTVGPLYYYLNAIGLIVFSFIFGLPMDFAARCTSILAFSISCLFLKRIGDHIAGSTGGWLAAVLFLICPLTRYIGHLVLGEAVSVAFVLCAVDSLLQGKNRRAGFLFGAGLLSRITLLAVLPALIWLIIASNKTNSIKRFKSFALPLGIFMIPFLIIMLAGRAGVFEAIINRQFENHSGFINLEALSFWFWGLSPGILFLGCWGTLRLVKTNKTLALFLGLWGILPGLQILTMSTALPRYFHLVGVAWILAATMCAPKSRDIYQGIRWAIITIFTLIAFAGPWYRPLPWNTSLVEGESIYRKTAQFIFKHSEPDDVIATGNPTLFYVFLRKPVLINIKAPTIKMENGIIYAEADHWGKRKVLLDKDVRYLVMQESDYQNFFSVNPDLASSFETAHVEPGLNSPIIRVLTNPSYEKKQQSAHDSVPGIGMDLKEALGLIRKSGMRIVNDSKSVEKQTE